MLKTNFNFDGQIAAPSGENEPVASGATSAGAGPALSELSPGEGACVVDVDVSAAAGRRLLDLGFLPGTPVRVLRRAPFGDPTLYELRGYRLCLRRVDAARVQVRRNENRP